MGKSMSVEQEWLAHPLSGVELRAMRRLKRRAFTTAGWRKMVARLGAAARLGFQGPPADVAARLVAFSLPTRTPTGAPCRRISASHPRASGLMHSDGPQMKNCGTGSMRTRSSESGDRTLIKIQHMWRRSTGKNMPIIENLKARCGYWPR